MFSGNNRTFANHNLIKFRMCLFVMTVYGTRYTLVCLQFIEKRRRISKQYESAHKTMNLTGCFHFNTHYQNVDDKHRQQQQQKERAVLSNFFVIEFAVFNCLNWECTRVHIICGWIYCIWAEQLILDVAVY